MSENDYYSLDNILSRVRAAKGSELTDAERETIGEQAAEIRRLQQAIDEQSAKEERERAAAEELDRTKVENEVLRKMIAAKPKAVKTSTNPEAESYGSRNRLVTKEQAETAKAWLKEYFSRTPPEPPAAP